TTPYQGFIRYPVDFDGRVRFADMIYKHEKQFFPSFDLLVSSVFQGAQPGIRFGPRGIENVFLGEGGVIPVSPSGRAYVNYLGKTINFPSVSAADVLSGNFDPLILTDKIVLVGITSPAITRELVSTPMGDLMSVLLVDATTVDMIQRKDFLSRPHWMIWVELITLVIVSILLAIGLRGLSAWGGVVSTLFLLAGVVVISHWVAFLNGIVVSLAPMLGAFSSIYLILSVYNFFREEKRSAEIRNAFQHYLSPAVVQQILGDPEKLMLGGEKKVLTVLFADVRNFTAITERLDPKSTTNLLNEYFSAMTDIIFQFEGLVDKFMGDAMMAVFGAPVEQPDHPLRACFSAIAMVKKVDELNRSGVLKEPLRIGVGVTTGEMIVGNMGSRDIFDYTVIGDTVNLGARIEKLNKIYKTQIIINAKTYESVGDQIVTRELDLIRVRGRVAPEKVYEVFDSNGDASQETLDLTKLWKEALSLYQDRKWKEALGHFQEILSTYPSDYPSEMYVKRCEQFAKNPPPKDWDGVFALTI
ncbi:MAG TPA: adenylate/guanylate cyclase domain-containing protein, partial [Bdellovibrionota bacterium]|nr:adenylate/guanylate cyclase domain-containing protein [Bdellovibrionota bacterium]